MQCVTQTDRDATTIHLINKKWRDGVTGAQLSAGVTQLVKQLLWGVWRVAKNGVSVSGFKDYELCLCDFLRNCFHQIVENFYFIN